MALKELTPPQDMHPYFDGGVFSGSDMRPDNRIAQAFSSGGGSLFYLDRLDKLYTSHNRSTNPFLGAAGMWFDPFLIDNASPKAAIVNFVSDKQDIIIVGEHDQANNVQRMYGTSGPTAALEELDAIGANPTLAPLGSFPFSSAILYEQSSGISSATPGFRNNANGRMIFFETWGFALQAGAGVEHTDDVFYSDVLALIDLSDGLATIVDYPIAHTSTPNAFQAGTLFGDDVRFYNVQFVPDSDSQLAAPKGRLYLGSLALPALDLGNVTRFYVQFVEWNPTGLAASPGNPNRVHLRREFLSRFDLRFDANPPTGMGTGVSDNGWIGVYHPPSDSVIVMASDGGDTSNNGHVRMSATTPILDTLTNPIALGTPETGRAVLFQTLALGDVAEPIGGVDVAWTLRRGSSFEEALDTTGLPATSTVANPPIDSDLLDVKFQDTLLIEGDDYTVDRSTGIITWQNGTNGNHPVDETGYTATYAHRTNTVSPPFGTLETQISDTDEIGKATARVRYADNDDLIGMTDEITAEQDT